MAITEVNPFTEGLMTEEDRIQVREQMLRMLDTHHFKNSRRYPALLRFIVEETLEGRGDQLKERLLGIRVFDRPADYDTAADPIVRVTIAEIRKRIAQYYHDEEHDAEIRIELLPGRYAPEFKPRRDQHASAHGDAEPPAKAPEPDLIEPSPAAQAPALPGRRWTHLTRQMRWALGAGGVVLLALCGILLYRWLTPTAADQFWGPILAPKKQVLLCIPTDVGKKSTSFEDFRQVPATVVSSRSGPTFLDYETIGENVVYSDVTALLNVTDTLVTRHRDYKVKLNVSTNLEDLRQGPAVLIGGLDNPWTMRALAPLPYHFAGSDEDRYWITNDKDPGSKAWSVDLKQQYASVTHDYAIIARIHSEQTGGPVIVIAGIGMSGTAAAGDFLGSADRLEELRGKIGSRFKDHDFELVLSTDVVNGIAGAPKILAVSVW